MRVKAFPSLMATKKRATAKRKSAKAPAKRAKAPAKRAKAPASARATSLVTTSPVGKSGYAVAVDRTQGGEMLTIFAADGNACLEIALTPGGLVVQLRSAALKIAAAGEIELGCKQLT